MIGFLLLIACIAWVIIKIAKNKDNKPASIRIPEIQNSSSIRDVVMAVNHGRVYPYTTGMTLEQVKKIVLRSYQNTAQFESSLQMYELIGYMPSIDLPSTPNRFIGRISMNLNRNKVISAITINIRDFQMNKEYLVEQMFMKFGKPISIDRQFMIWREQYMVINIDATNGSISVINERLFGC